MAEHLILSIRMEDPELLAATIAEYVAAVKRGRMSVEQAEEDVTALALGMMKVDVSGGAR